MKLQLALDLVDMERALALLAEMADLVDIVEVGTPFIIRDGVEAVRTIRRAHPDLTILADLKIMDAGDHEARIALEAGADIVTVLGAAHDVAVEGAVAEAKNRGRQVMVDLIAVPDVAARTREVDGMGVDYVCVHTAADLQDHGIDPLEELRLVKPCLRQASMAVAGGIKPETLRTITPYCPEIVVGGGFVTNHPDPRRAATEIRQSFS